MESHKAVEPCDKLYKTGEEEQIFWGFRNFKTRTKGKKQTKQNLFGFLSNKPN